MVLAVDNLCITVGSCGGFVGSLWVVLWVVF